MGDELAAAAVQFRRSSGGTWPLCPVDSGRDHRGDRASSRQTDDTGDARTRRATRSQNGDAATDDLAAVVGAGGNGIVHRLDFYAVGRRVGFDPDLHRARRLVLAQDRRRMNRPPRTLDVTPLPDYAFGHRSPMWWGTM